MFEPSPEEDFDEELSSKGTESEAGGNDGAWLAVVDIGFDERLASEVRVHGTTTRSLTASKAAETHKSIRLSQNCIRHHP